MDETEANTTQSILLADFIRLLQANQNDVSYFAALQYYTI